MSADGVSYPPPVAATVAPPGVNEAGAVGTASPYARSDHTHASKVRKGATALQSNVVTYTWVYPTPFGSGVVPVCSGIAQTASGVTDLVNIQIEGAPTNTQCIFRVTRYSQSFLSLLGLNVLTFNSGAISITLHMVALEP
jgi:hypothetical protein